MIRVYATCFWQSDAELLSDITKYGFGKAEWKNLVFTDSKDLDVAVVLTAPWRECHDFAPNRTVRFLTEPPISSHHRDVADTVCPIYLPLPWWTHSAHRSEIVRVGMPGEKTELISSVTSELAYLDGHIKRLKFLYALDSVIAEGLDVFGKRYSGEIFSKMNNYRGELKDKYDGLLPYEYHINCENSFLNGYFTEKLLDPILAESLCFYDGCTNVEEYVDQRAFVRIDITNIEESILRIEQCVNDGYYEKQLPYILREKRRILYTLNPLFDSILETLQRGEEVNVKNFGKFDLKYSKSRKKRGSNNTESANIPKKVRVVFNAKRTFKIDEMMIDKTKP